VERGADPGQGSQAERKLDELCTSLAETTPAATDNGSSDAAILRSLPGVGMVTLATLFTEAAGPFARRDYAVLRPLSGVAPVTKRSGKSCVVVMRYAAQVRLRQAVFHWARAAVQHDPKSCIRYEALRARGHSHDRALRSVADRLTGVACTLLRRQMLFDPRARHVGRPVADRQQTFLSSNAATLSSPRPPLGIVPRASAVREAAQRHRREPAHSVLDGASMVLCSTVREDAHTGAQEGTSSPG
jgi:hypothetical protein